MAKSSSRDMFQVMLKNVKEQGDFEYIKGYTALNSDARFKCNCCNEIVFLKPRIFVYNKNKPVCYKCNEKPRKRDEIYTIQKLNENMRDKSKVVIETHEEHVVYRCLHCNHEYRHYNTKTMSGIKSFLTSNNPCCKSGMSKAEKKARAILRECWSSMDNDFLHPEDIRDYIKDYFGFLSDELKYYIDIEYIKNYVIEGFLERYKKEHIKECDYCGKIVRGKTNWDKDKIACRRCSERQFVCQCCGREEKLKNFSIENKEYSRHCKECESVLKDLENGIENDGWLYTYHKDNIDKYFIKHIEKKKER